MVEQILRMLLANDEGGLVLLKQEFGARINYIVKSILTNEEDAAECINDIYFSVWRNAASYDSTKAQFTTWLTVVCRNTALNVAKKKNLVVGSLNYNLTSDSYLPEDELLRQEREAALDRAIASLTKRELQLFYRKYYYCQSTAQIAAELNLTQRAVEGRLYRLRQKIQRLLGGDLL